MVNFLKGLDRNIYISYIVTIALFIGALIFGISMDLDSEQTANVIEYSWLELFLHNSILSIMNYLGILSFGIYNFFLLIFNSIEIGYALKFGVVNSGFYQTSLIFVPHAIFELPSILLSFSTGFLPLIILINYSRKKTLEKGKILYYLKYLLFSFTVVISLNFIAALVEGFISMGFSVGG